MRHCEHWVDGDSDCHYCGAENWCPDGVPAGMTDAEIEARWPSDGCTVGATRRPDACT